MLIHQIWSPARLSSEYFYCMGRDVICSAFCPGAVATNIQESGKTRPEKFAETGYAESDKRRQGSADFGHLFMTKEEVGERVREGIEGDELFICTHEEFLGGVTERVGGLLLLRRVAIRQSEVRPPAGLA